MDGRTRHLAAALTGLGLGLVALGPGLAPGFLLSYDMVFVPDPAFTPLTFGLTGTVPRHVPSDAVATALSTVVPAWAAQRLLLLAVFVMACTAAASLVPSRRLVPRLAAGICYAWNPFVAERLLLGQWALLLGYAALPWVVAAAIRVDEDGGGRRLVRVLIPAAIGGFAALTVSGVTALAVTATRKRAALEAKVLAILAVLSLPWLVAGLLRAGGVPGDGVAVEAFASRADTPFGTLGSVLLLGGIWNSETVPTGYGTRITAALWAAVVLGALFAYVTLGRSQPWWRGAAVAAGAGFVVASLGAVVPSLLEDGIHLWSGLAVLRDGQQFVAPLAVVIAIGLGLAADKAFQAKYSAAAFGALAAPVVLLPSLAWGAGGQLRSVDYPRDWARARTIIDADQVPGDVLVLPWAPYRSYPWNHGRRVLDPLPRYLHRRVIVNDALQVGPAAVPSEDPKARRLDEAIRSAGPLTETLSEAGVRYVAVDVRDPAAPASLLPGPDRLPGAETVLRGDDLLLYRIVPGPVAPEKSAPVAAVAGAWIITSGAIVWSIVMSATNVSALPGSIPRRRDP